MNNIRCYKIWLLKVGWKINIAEDSKNEHKAFFPFYLFQFLIGVDVRKTWCPLVSGPNVTECKQIHFAKEISRIL